MSTRSKPHILFVCGRNQWRSPTAAAIYANDQRIEVRSAGVSPLSAHRVSQKDMEWANLVLVMERKHEDRLVEMFRDMTRPPIASLEIADDFGLMDQELVDLIREGTESHLAAMFGIGHETPPKQTGNIGAVRPCNDSDFNTIHLIVNDATQAYKGVIPADCWHVPYMPEEELRASIASGIEFWGFETNGALVGVMGIQPVQNITLIRHAYVRTSHRRHGIGGLLLKFLLGRINTPTLIGTWAAADWAIRFYQKYGFKMVSPTEKNRLLPLYWGVPVRQIETSVVLGDERWFASCNKGVPPVQQWQH